MGMLRDEHAVRCQLSRVPVATAAAQIMGKSCLPPLQHDQAIVPHIEACHWITWKTSQKTLHLLRPVLYLAAEIVPLSTRIFLIMGGMVTQGAAERIIHTLSGHWWVSWKAISKVEIRVGCRVSANAYLDPRRKKTQMGARNLANRLNHTLFHSPIIPHNWARKVNTLQPGLTLCRLRKVQVVDQLPWLQMHFQCLPTLLAACMASFDGGDPDLILVRFNLDKVDARPGLCLVTPLELSP